MQSSAEVANNLKPNVVSQGDYWSRHPSAVQTDGNFVEHTFQKQHDVLVVTLNIPGSSNNGVDSW